MAFQTKSTCLAFHKIIKFTFPSNIAYSDDSSDGLQNCTLIFIFTSMYVCMYVCMCVCVCVCVYVCMYVCMYGG